jgi:hypothetical protein
MTFVKIWTLAKHVRILLYEQFKFHMHFSYVLFYVIKVQNSSLMIQHKNHVFVVVCNLGQAYQCLELHSSTAIHPTQVSS